MNVGTWPCDSSVAVVGCSASAKTSMPRPINYDPRRKRPHGRVIFTNPPNTDNSVNNSNSRPPTTQLVNATSGSLPFAWKEATFDMYQPSSNNINTAGRGRSNAESNFQPPPHYHFQNPNRTIPPHCHINNSEANEGPVYLVMHEDGRQEMNYVSRSIMDPTSTVYAQRRINSGDSTADILLRRHRQQLYTSHKPRFIRCRSHDSHQDRPTAVYRQMRNPETDDMTSMCRVVRRTPGREHLLLPNSTTAIIKWLRSRQPVGRHHHHTRLRRQHRWKYLRHSTCIRVCLRRRLLQYTSDLKPTTTRRPQ